MKLSKNLFQISALAVLVMLLASVCGSVLHSLFPIGSYWQLPHFSLLDGCVVVGAMAIIFGTFFLYYQRLEKNNKETVDGAMLVINELERQLSQNEKDNERFNLFMQATGDGIWDWNLSDNKFYFSSRWKAILGFTDDEFEGSFVEWQNLVHPEDLGKLLMMWPKIHSIPSRIRQLLIGGFPSYEFLFGFGSTGSNKFHCLSSLNQGYLAID